MKKKTLVGLQNHFFYTHVKWCSLADDAGDKIFLFTFRYDSFTKIYISNSKKQIVFPTKRAAGIYDSGRKGILMSVDIQSATSVDSSPAQGQYGGLAKKFNP